VNPCGTCAYYVLTHGASGDASLGQCHRYPPDLDGVWPHVEAADWCGEWRTKEGG
jgi:hypothetical protein